MKIFRKNRKKLLVEKKVSKYILYAVGEIVLVVVGILIALQINNYSEKRKEQLLESQLIDVLITDLKLKKQECVQDLANCNDLINESKNTVSIWRKHEKIDTTDIKLVLINFSEDTWFYNENSPIYAGLSSSDFWKQLPISLTNSIDDVYRVRLSTIKKTFEKSSEYATYCKLNFLRPNDLINLNRSSKEINEILTESKWEFISYLELFRSNVYRLIINFENSISAIDNLVEDLVNYKIQKKYAVNIDY